MTPLKVVSVGIQVTFEAFCVFLIVAGIVGAVVLIDSFSCKIGC